MLCIRTLSLLSPSLCFTIVYNDLSLPWDISLIWQPLHTNMLKGWKERNNLVEGLDVEVEGFGEGYGSRQLPKFHEGRRIVAYFGM